MIITTERLRYFVTVAQTGSFSAAARELGVSTSAVNKTIACLEDALEVALFHRHSGKKPTLSSKGKALYFKGLEVLPRILGMEQYAESLKQGVETQVTLAVHPYSFTTRYAQLIKQFQQSFSQVQLNIIDSEQLESFEEGFDLLLTPSKIEIVRGLNLATIDQLEWLIVCAPDFPLAKLKGEVELADLEGQPQLLLPEGFITKPEYREALRYSSNIIKVSHFYQFQQLLLQGAGFAAYPAALATPFITKNELIALNFDFGNQGNTWPIDLVWSDNIGTAGHWLVEQLTER